VVDEAAAEGEEEVRRDGHAGDEVLVYERLVLQLLVLRRREGRRPRRPPPAAHRLLLLLVVVVLLRVGLPHPAKGRQKAKPSSPHEMPRRPASINKEASG